METWHYPVLFLTALTAGFVDSIAGGGGLITIPVLLSLGLSPSDALGTNKLQASFGSGSAAWHYAKAGAVNLRECGLGFGISFLSAAGGAWSVRQMDPSVLRRLIPMLLVAVAVYLLWKPKLGQGDVRPRLSERNFHLVFGAGIGFYDGFFGPGTGTFWTMAYMVVLGFSMTRATAWTKVMNFASNISSLALFLWGGNVLWGAGLVMGAGQFLGARLGAGLVMARGTKLIRPVFLTMVLILTVKLLFDQFGPMATR